MTVTNNRGGAHGSGDAAWSSWLSSLPLCCCAPLASPTDNDKRQRRRKSPSTSACTAIAWASDSSSTLNMSWPPHLGRLSDERLLMGQVDEKHSYQYPVIYDQPLEHPRPVAMPGMEMETDMELGRDRSHHDHNVLGKAPRGIVTPKRKRFWSFTSSSAASTSRRPPISAPSDFRHIYSASPQFPEIPGPEAPEPTPSRASNLRPAKQLPHRPYRPLELSIYQSDNRVSPILPHFSPPPAPSSDYSSACVSDQSDCPLGVGKLPLEHQKSFSDSLMSFHFPRRQALESSPSTTQDDDVIPPLIPPKARARSRAFTSPDVDKIKERVASAMLEVEKLQKQIDDVIERQSLYTASRPSTPHSMAQTMPELEPMPSIPALPPAAPSFAQRLNADIDRPHTAPIRTPPHTPVRVALNPPRRARTPGEPSTPTGTPPRVRRNDVPLPPPLPLVLRPPLRKKKSFSRVSSWLFPGAQQHSRNLSFDSVTNAPRPIKGNEGFYQVSLGGTSERRRSTDSVDTISTWESDDEDRTVPTTCSLGSTPAMPQDEPLISRFATFGRSNPRPNRTSVGVAI
ncbi:hypothetical protein FALBO_6967 [Fusarium albosuccineum]|uniref:Uncharacterized protein n=1 Tax=Fusarium albosuccineum TaxID=1237068 RepID=A0A8H4PE61_9HYPO|nr:hypothetical protein FALBO_6967 [Fusarium albosuccineum]